MENKKIKILYIHHSGRYGGAPRSLSYLLKNIDLKKYEPKLINIAEGPINSFLKDLPGDFEIVKGIRPFHGSTVAEKSFKSLLVNFIFLVPSILRAYRVLKQNEADIIHLNSTCLFAFAIASKFLKRETKVISHVREPLRTSISGKITAFFIRMFTHGVIAISEFDLKSLNINKPEIKTIVIHNFVEESDIPKILDKDFVLHKKINISKSSIVFLYLARFAESNGWKQLIEMAFKIIPDNPEFHFVLVGAHSQEDLSYIQHPNIHLLPFQENVASLFLNSDVFVCPFVEPHFSRGVIEASYAGLPIIASNVGSVNELLVNNKTGFLYENFSSFEKYAVALGSDAELRKTLGAGGIKYARQNFNLKKQCTHTFNFYKTILGTSHKL
tara:strand:+ start:4096 stop:5250 length:1155 start_codon:yes stop_codon:yes gene_type:complete